MSLTGQRQAFVTSLADVDGVKAFKYRPDTPKTGDAWPLIREMERGPAGDFAVTWVVVVLLPSDERKASDWFEENVEPIAEALEDFGYLEQIEPANGDMDGNLVPIMMITVRREA